MHRPRQVAADTPSLYTFIWLCCSLSLAAGQCPFSGAQASTGVSCPGINAHGRPSAARRLLSSKVPYEGAQDSGFFEIQSFDGWNNNKVHPLWGAAGQLMRRFESSQYGDGFSRPGGADRPNPRVISTSVMNAVGFGAHDDGKMPLNGNRILCLALEVQLAME